MADNKALVEALNNLLADVVVFYFQAHGSHWNVEGSDFSQYHSLFEQIYEDAYGSIDPIAENIRKLGDFVPFNLKTYLEFASIDLKPVKPSVSTMAKSLLANNDLVLESIDKAFKAAMKANEQGIANFLAERDDMHKKWRWFLTASTKG